MSWILLAALSYLIGSIPFGVWLAQRAAHIDIRQRGSGNVGATNVAREVGLGWGMLTLLLDGLKGLVPVVLARWSQPGCDGCMAAMALTALLGHQYSVFLRFRGGKGVATAMGAFVAIAPLPAAAGLLLFVLLVFTFGFVSVGSLGATAMMPVFLWLTGQGGALVGMSAAMACMIWVRHRENIKRLVSGQELRWRKGDFTSADRGAGPAHHRNSKRS
jgi:glycerol-3-phosphate acyltransferase PlsY